MGLDDRPGPGIAIEQSELAEGAPGEEDRVADAIHVARGNHRRAAIRASMTSPLIPG